MEKTRKRYKFIALSKYAERYLSVDDIEELTEMIGSEIEESSIPSFIDGKSLFIMPDGQEAHVDFLELEQIQPELPFENKTP